MKEQTKKVITRLIFGSVYAYCPTCGRDLTKNLGVSKCIYCGQKLSGQDTKESGQVIGYLYNSGKDDVKC